MTDTVTIPIGPRGWTGVVCGQRKVGSLLLRYTCGGAIVKKADGQIVCERCGHVPDWV